MPGSTIALPSESGRRRKQRNNGPKLRDGVMRRVSPPDSEQVDPPVVAAKTPSGELDLAPSQVREAVLLTDLVGRAVRDRGKGVDW